MTRCEDSKAATKQADKRLTTIEKKQAATDAVKRIGQRKNGNSRQRACSRRSGWRSRNCRIGRRQQELNRRFGKLRFNAFNEGFDSENVEEALKGLLPLQAKQIVAVETVSNLMQTGFSDEQLSQAIDHINGAALKFSDTLKTEGIADGFRKLSQQVQLLGCLANCLKEAA